MSEALFAGLPRFDSESAQTSLPPPGSWQRSLDADSDVGIEEVIQQEEPVLTEPVLVQFSPPEPTAADLDVSAIERALSALDARLGKIERDAHAQALEVLQATASKLFPALAERFLADEIGLHLEKLVPLSAAVVEIRASTEVAEKLRTRIEATAGLANRCTVTPAHGTEQSRVDVSWQTGGVSFDFDGLLEACPSQLNSNPSVTRK